MKNEEILIKLKKAGVKIYKQKLSIIFSNPFYCGIISTKMLEGELVEGTHAKLISHNLFLDVNKVRAESKGKYGITHTREQEQVPLKVFMKCDCCGHGYTGYVVKAKNLWYYKCRTIGCRKNKNAKKLNSEFADCLSDYVIKDHMVAPFLEMMKSKFGGLDNERKEERKRLEIEAADINKKIDSLEENFFINKSMPEETYRKFIVRLTDKRNEIAENLTNCKETSLNLDELLKKAVGFSSKVSAVRTSGDVTTKERLQKLIFPHGIIYDRKNEAFRTEKINEVFRQIACLNSISGGNEKGQIDTKINLSNQVGKTDSKRIH